MWNIFVFISLDLEQNNVIAGEILDYIQNVVVYYSCWPRSYQFPANEYLIPIR